MLINKVDIYKDYVVPAIDKVIISMSVSCTVMTDKNQKYWVDTMSN
jgi:hypothetical protein